MITKRGFTVIVLKLSFGEVYRQFYSRKLHYTAPLARCRKIKFPTINRRFTPPNDNFEYSFPTYGIGFVLFLAVLENSVLPMG